DHKFSREAGVPARSARDDLHVAELAELLFRDVHLIEKNFPGHLRNSAQESVAHGARLLENLLLHEMLEAALLRHDRVPGDVLDGPFDFAAFEIEQAHALRRK